MMASLVNYRYNLSESVKSILGERQNYAVIQFLYDGTYWAWFW